MDWPSDNLHAAYYTPLNSGNEGKDENLLPPDERDTEAQTNLPSLSPLLLAPEIYLFTLVAVYPLITR